MRLAPSCLSQDSDSASGTSPIYCTIIECHDNPVAVVAARPRHPFCRMPYLCRLVQHGLLPWQSSLAAVFRHMRLSRGCLQMPHMRRDRHDPHRAAILRDSTLDRGRRKGGRTKRQRPPETPACHPEKSLAAHRGVLEGQIPWVANGTPTWSLIVLVSLVAPGRVAG